MIDYFIFDLSRTVMMILATLIFAWVSYKRRDLVSWLFAYIAVTFSEIFRLVSQEEYDLFELISITFSALSVILIIIAVSIEYFQTFHKTSITKTNPLILILLVTFSQLFYFGLQLIIGVLVLIAIILIIRVYSNKRTPTHAFLCFILICGLLNLIAALLNQGGIEGAEEFYQFTNTIMTTILLITGVVALIEDRLVRSEKSYRMAYNRAEFYKDLFVHDINNILQNLQFSLEIMSQNLEGYERKEELDELVKIAKNQVNRGAELGLNVKKLSDLEMGAIKNEPIEIYNVLEQIITDIKIKFSEEEIKIDIIGDRDKIYVNANILLEDVIRIILNNAIRYNDNPIKEISIQISKKVKDFGSDIKIEFIDNGVGIPDIMKKTIFQPVYKKTKDFKRIGLGLLLANEVIRNISGKIWVEDKVQGDHTQGSNVIILIPEAYGILDIER